MGSAEVLSLATGTLLLWLGVEVFLHRRALARIPVRIHVNGTRGKSSVTRLLAAGLGAEGKVVIAKTTGTLARVIVPNQSELSVFRPLGANVKEQIRIVRFAAERKADILVVECMALQPYLQWLSEKAFVRATHGVITNARPDHLDVMGPSGDDVARALCGMMPRKARCYTAERERVEVLRGAAADRETELSTIEGADVEALSEADLAGFRHYAHPENVALALRICTDLGVDREAALEGMRNGRADPGALTFHEVDFFGRAIVFANAFAANDPVSSEQIWNLCLERFPEHRPLCVVNCRADRADRSRQLGEAIPSWAKIGPIMAVGTGTEFLRRALGDYDSERVQTVESEDPREVFECIVEAVGRKTLVVGLGNIGGVGLELVRLFRNRAQLDEDEQGDERA